MEEEETDLLVYTVPIAHLSKDCPMGHNPPHTSGLLICENTVSMCDIPHFIVNRKALSQQV